MTWKLWSYPIPFSFQGFTVVHCACHGKCPELGRSYLHFTVLIDRSFRIAEHGMLNLNSMVLLYLVPKFISLPYTALSSVSIHWMGADQNWQGLFLLAWRKKWLWNFFKKIFSMKRDDGGFLSSQPPMVTFGLPLPSASLMLLIHGLKLIPWYQRKQQLHVLPAHFLKTQSRKLPGASMNINPKIFWTALLIGEYRFLLPLSYTRQILHSLCMWRSVRQRSRAEKYQIKQNKSPPQQPQTGHTPQA